MLLIAMNGYGQITMNACNPLFDNQDFTFNNLGADATGRHIFETTPIIGDQPCSGVGVCELRISWNDSQSRWELIADDGNGDFNTSFVIYYNEENSMPNPPSLLLGTWIENVGVTANHCGGNGTDSIHSMVGEVQDTTLSIDLMTLQVVEFYPNPSKDVVYLKGVNTEVLNVRIYDITGKEIRRQELLGNLQLDISELSKGIYFVELNLNEQSVLKKLIKH